MIKMADGKKHLCLREKLLSKGAECLSDAELLAVFISSGTRHKDCYTLANELLKQLGDLRAIATANLSAFKNISGLGPVRFTQLQAIKEICRRADFITLQKTMTFTQAEDAARYLKRRLRDKKNETFAVLFLDNQHRLIAYEELFHGTINAASIYARPLIERILIHNAASVIVSHNHPSGHAKASQEDIQITQHLQAALQLVDTQLLDHFVIGDNEVYSICSNMKWMCH